MIMINGNWESVKDLSDVLRIVSENMGSEFAYEIEKIFRDMQDKIAYELEKMYENNENRIEELENKIAKLEEKIMRRN